MAVHLVAHDDYTELLLDRPDKRNALNVEMSTDIARALADAASLAGPLVIASSTPGMFVSGADIRDLAARTRIEALLRLNHQLFLDIEAFPRPTIAVADGPALGGGCELALACDVRIASSRSVWGLPEVRLGIIPAGGGLHRLPRIIGWGRASELLLSGRTISAAEAERIGLVNRTCAPGELEEATAALVREFGQAAPNAVAYAKQAMRTREWESGLTVAALQALCFESDESAERLNAFLATRRNG